VLANVLKVTNKDVPRKVIKILNAVQQRKHRWMGHVLPTTRNHRRKNEGYANKRKERLQTLCDLTKGDGYAHLLHSGEQLGKGRDGDSGMTSESCCTAVLKKKTVDEIKFN